VKRVAKRILIVAALLAALGLGGLAALGWAQRPEARLPPGTAGKKVMVDGTPIRYVQSGSGPDVLLVHGSPGSVEDWEPVWARLSRSFRVTAFDRPGHGYSGGADRPHTPDENAAVALGVIRALRLHDVVYVGHSFGGVTGLALALRDPPEVRAFVIVAAHAYGPVPVEARYRALAIPLLGPGLARLLAPLVGRGQIEKGVRASFGPNADAMPADFVARRLPLWTRPAVTTALSQERTGLGSALAAMEPRYRDIRKPVVIVCGAEDHNRGDAERLARDIPGSRLVTLANTGHYVQFARPDALVAAIGEASGSVR
jgi:pimeloyl-ACP methyl ester carboxylesterase